MIPPASEPLCANGVRLGAIAMTPWDTEIFGFPVAQMTIESDLDVVAAAPEFAATLKAFADARDIALVSTRIPVSKPAVVAALCGIGFQVVDHAIEARLPRLQRCKLTHFAGRPARSDRQRFSRTLNVLPQRLSIRALPHGWKVSPRARRSALSMVGSSCVRNTVRDEHPVRPRNEHARRRLLSRVSERHAR
jgi:hypothetical protein